MGAHTVWNVEKQELVLCDFCPIHISWWVWLFFWCLWTTYYFGRILLQIQISCLRALSCCARHVEFFINLSKTRYLCWGLMKNIWENWFFCKEITPYHPDPRQWVSDALRKSGNPGCLLSLSVTELSWINIDWEATKTSLPASALGLMQRSAVMEEEGHQKRQDDSWWPENSGVRAVTAKGVIAVTRTGIQTQDVNQYTTFPF